jgi:hypothetical protein
MKVVVSRSLIRMAAARWQAQYLTNSGWKQVMNGSSEKVYEKLRALDPDTASAKDVTDAIGNQSWSSYWCSECEDYTERAIAIEGGDSATYLCPSCVKHAWDLIRPTVSSGEQHED